MDVAAAVPAAASGTARKVTAEVDKLTSFYAAEYPRLAASLTLYSGDPHVGAELAQEAMARACRHWHRVQHLNSPAGWVHRVGINLANSAFKRTLVRQRARHIVARPDDNSPAADIGPAVAVRAAVAELPQRQRMALVLRYFADLPVDEVAELMKCSPNTVKSLTHQAIAKLRKTAGLTEDEDEDDTDAGGRSDA